MSKSNKLKILLLSSGGPGASGVIKSLKKSNSKNFIFLGCDADSYAQNKNYLESFFVVPKRKHEKKYIKAIEKIYFENNIDLIYPLSSDDITIFINHSNDVDKSVINSLVKFKNSYSILIDKFKTYEKIKDTHFCPKYKVFKNKESFKEYFEKNKKDVLYAKPRVSSGSRGNFLIKQETSISDYMMKKGCNIIEIEAFAKINGIDFSEYIFCEYLPGIEFSIDVFSDQGKLLNSCIRERTKVKGGISHVAKVIVNEDLEKLSAEICKIFKIDGAANIQFKKSKKGEYKLIEVNPRTSGTICVATEAGVNIVDLVIRKFLGLEYKKIYPKKSKELTMIRYIEEFYLND